MKPGMTRRDLFSLFSGFSESPGLRDEVQATPEREPPGRAERAASPLRPPGALPEGLLADTCIRCGACVKTCPRQAIRPLPQAYGHGAGTPFILAREAPCVLCHGFLCTTVCPSGALRPVVAMGEVHMGRAVVDVATCLPWHGTPCSACHDKCPVPGAISLDQHGRPHIGPSCTGCGLCENYCPTEPAAVKVRPQAELP